MAYSDYDFSTYSDSMIASLCKEYESLWLVDARNFHIHIYDANEATVNKNAVVEVNDILKDYEKARKYYISSYVVEEHRKRLLEETTVENVLENIAEGKLYYVEYKRIFGDEINYNQLVYAKVKEDENVITHFLMGFRDIDKRKKAERDELTGLYTRRAFIQYAEEELKNSPDIRYNLILSDIVDFKQINENYGVLEGDRILRSIGKHLRAYVKDKEHIVVGRYGGDQFAMLIADNSIDEDSKQNVGVPGDYVEFARSENLPPHISKYGIYNDVAHDASIITICDYAHVALNSIKNEYTKSVAFYDDELKKKVAVQRKIVNCMHDALESDQFKVYYQPKHDAKTGRLVGAEALIRWIHPEYGFMSPADFIPIFEANGFVTEVDLYVWERTCKNIKRWLADGIKVVPLSVNASKSDFRDDSTVDRIEEIVQRIGVSHDYLHIEVTETLLEDDMNRLVGQLDKLRDCGFKVELDDFGAGYSSINFLSQLPLDIVKLDMSFMRDIGNTKRKRVLAACINLSKNLGYKTVSEGVETDEQLELLKNLGADMIQGYYFSKPLPEEEFEQYLKEHV